jgi:hypothetical protein
LRYKLQTEFLTKGQEPKARNMAAMSEHLEKLERMISPPKIVLTSTNINKVLKRIMKLDQIPKDDEFDFKKRATELFKKWDVILRHEDEPAATSTAQSQSEHAPEPPFTNLTESSDEELSSHSTSDQGTTESLSPSSKSPYSFP